MIYGLALDFIKYFFCSRKFNVGGRDNHGMYKFSDSNTSCAVDDDEQTAMLTQNTPLGGSKRKDHESNPSSIYEQLPRELLRDLRRSQHFQRLGDDNDETVVSNSKAIMLKDLVSLWLATCFTYVNNITNFFFRLKCLSLTYLVFQTIAGILFLAMILQSLWILPV